MKKKLLAASLAALMLASSLASCATDEGGTDTDSTPVVTDVTAPVEETTAPHIPERNLDGFTFRVNARSDQTGNSAFAVKDLWVEGTTGEPINDAVYERNAMMEQTYNFTIEQVYSAANQLGEIRTAVSAGDSYEAAIVLGTSVASLAQEGCLYDLYSVPHVDFTGAWWDQNAVEAFTLMDKMFFTTGDMNTVAFDRTCVTTFSKKLIEDNGLENPYDLVREGKWTLDKVYEMGTVANRDMDGDGKLTSEGGDTVGFFVYSMSPLYYFYGAGERMSTYDEAGKPVLTVNNERAVNVVDKMYQYLNQSNPDVTVGLWAPMRTMFTENRALFANVAVSDAKGNFRENCEEDFGFLPIAKFTEDQDRYYNLVAFQDWTHLWCIPTTCSDTDKVGFLFEAFAYHSTDTVRRAYYDITLSGKVVRDKDSNEMLDLIFANRVYDIATIYDWGGWNSYFTSTFVKQNSNSFAAVAKKSATKAQKQIDDTVAAYMQNVE
ncbi:MAG: hypothetical protein IJD06_03505 [Clostridia bacterium]|nr:hypothetical protein [Clostridia bacterium]